MAKHLQISILLVITLIVGTVMGLAEHHEVSAINGANGTSSNGTSGLKGANGTSLNGTAGLKGANGTSGPHAHGANGNSENGVNGNIANGANGFRSHGTNGPNAATMPKFGMFY